MLLIRYHLSTHRAPQLMHIFIRKHNRFEVAALVNARHKESLLVRWLMHMTYFFIAPENVAKVVAEEPCRLRTSRPKSKTPLVAHARQQHILVYHSYNPRSSVTYLLRFEPRGDRFLHVHQ